jgi:hypothetical protein
MGVMLTKWHHNEFRSKAYVDCIWAIVEHFDGTSQEVFHSLITYEYKRLLLVVKAMEK